MVDKRKQHVLFVCAANVFRSKLAERALRDSYEDQHKRLFGQLEYCVHPLARAENLEDPGTASILRAHGVKPPTGPCRRVEWAGVFGVG